ncbi:MAG: hypothetical protein IH840_15010 [Candidatus Heimdallarchaeota archaeon]|nr:hypothetical protein [Candidatus Heimdallarchaeota archaeon]
MPKTSIDQYPTRFWIYIIVPVVFHILFLIDLINFDGKSLSRIEVEQLYSDGIRNVSSSVFWEQGVIGEVFVFEGCVFYYPTFYALLLWKFSIILLALGFRIYAQLNWENIDDSQILNTTSINNRNNYLIKLFQSPRVKAILILLAYFNLVKLIWWIKAEYSFGDPFYPISPTFILIPLFWFAILTNKKSSAVFTIFKLMIVIILESLFLIGFYFDNKTCSYL